MKKQEELEKMPEKTRIKLLEIEVERMADIIKGLTGFLEEQIGKKKETTFWKRLKQKVEFLNKK
jgi:hypothetical protein